MKKKTGWMVAVLMNCVGAAFAGGSPGGMSVDEIVGKANYMALYQGGDVMGRVEMVITDRQGRTRKRVFTMLRKDVGEGDRDQRYYVLFHEPADVRRTVFMVHKHAAPGKDDDRWLYLPGLDLVKRIASSDKRTSFVGSDFLYEEISGRSMTEDRHELLRTTDAHYVVKNVPKQPQAVEFAYYLAYVDRDSFMPVKMEFFKKADRLYRVVEVERLENVAARENGRAVSYPTVMKTVARDLDTGSRTEMLFSGVSYNSGLKDELFSERYLRKPPREAMR